MRFLFVFLDGVGLGASDPLVNPFAHGHLPHLESLLGGRPFVLDSLPVPDDPLHNYYLPLECERATLAALDAGLGVPGLPQSATGQAVLLTGINIPQAIGYHYGPKPNLEVAEFLRNGNLFNTLRERGKKAALINAYPPRYFHGIESGRRLFSSIPLAVASAGIPLKTQADLFAGEALSADFTGQGWRERLGLPDTPILTLPQAGERMADLAADYDLAFFEYWLSDYAGHRQDMAEGCALLETIDQVLGGLLGAWDDDQGLILITSDHGNLEDLSTRRHTANPVPALLIGAKAYRQRFVSELHDLTDITPAILNFLNTGN
jgi:2,3-bisphosphoglycerate-independent phosphoglycerate mutase